MQYLAYWSSEGLESIQDISRYSPDNWKKQEMIDKIAGKNTPLNPLHSMLTLMEIRARANEQRCYELYAFECDASLESLQQLFLDTPQMIVDLIRERGVKIFGNPVNKTPVIT